MARPFAEAEDYQSIRDHGEAHVQEVALRLFGGEATRLLAKAGLLAAGVLDALSDLPPEDLNGVLVDALGPLAANFREEWPALVQAAGLPAQRRRRCFARAPPEVGMHWSHVLGVSLAAPPPPQVSVGVPVVPGPPARPFRWATRGRKGVLGGAAHAGVDAAEAVERDRWARAAADLIVEAKLPVAELASRVLGGPGCVKSVFGGRRLRTLRLRVRGARRLLRWIGAAGFGGFPRGDEGVRAVLAYVADLVAGRAARSAPAAAVHALRFFEVRGGIEERLQVSLHPLVSGAVAEAELALTGGAVRAVRKAPFYPREVIAAMERHVVDGAVLPYVRVFAWFRLVLVWTACRSDDLRRVSPGEVKFDNGVLEVRLRRTKTTGPDKRVTVAYAWVGPGSWVVFGDWLSVGFGLFQSLSVDDGRDYLLPLPTQDLLGCRRAPADYARVLEMGRALLVDLRSAVGGRLLSPAAALMWSEHSGRAVLPTWGAALGEPESVLDRLGRWSDGKSSGYVRANRAILLEAQARIAEGVRLFASPVLAQAETDLAESLRSHLVGRGVDDDAARAEVAKLVPDAAGTSAQAPCLALAPAAAPPSVSSSGSISGVRFMSEGGSPPGSPRSGVLAVSASSVAGGMGVPSGSAPPTPGSASDSDVEPRLELPVGSLVVAITLRSKRRTLHRIPGCGRRPGVAFRDFAVLEGPAVAGDYTHVCRQCWPPTSASPARGSASRNSSSGSSSTSRSSESSTTSADE